jgi:hypothetical protein
MMEFKDIQPRNFIPSRGARDRGEKRREHVMLIGGRDGPAVAGLPPRDPRYWSEGEQARWTRELESDSTYPDAKTQSRLLREVRPEQRLYGRGYMKVGDMSEILMRNLTMTRGRPVPIELTLVQENGELLALPLTVKEGPVFSGLLPTKSAEEYRGVPITWNQGDDQESLSDILAAAGEFAKLNMPIIVTGGDGSVTRALAPRVEGTDLIWAGGSLPLPEVRSIDLLDPTDMDIQDKPFFARLVGVMGEFEGMLQLYPYFLIARLRAIRQRREGLPVPQAAMFLGDTTKTEKVRQKAEKHLKQFTELTWARRLKKFGKDPLIFDVAATDPVTGFKFLVDQDKNLYWASAGSSEVDPVALLRPLYPGTGAILVNVDDYLRLLRMSGAKEMTGSVKSNPSRGPMRNFMNPVHYMSDRELEIMAAQEGLSVSGLLSKYAGRIKRKSERPSKSKSTEMGYLSAGRRAAQTGAGLKITRRNSGWDPVMYEIEPGIVYEPDVTAPPEFVSNPFQKVTEPGPGKIQVTSKRGKTLYMTQNQIAKMGDKMLAPGEVERALSNPRTFRGEQTPARRKRDTKEVRRRTAERAAFLATVPQGLYSDDVLKPPSRRKYPAGWEGSGQRQRRELQEFHALLPDIPIKSLEAMDFHDILTLMDERGVMHPKYEGMAMRLFGRENPRHFRGVKQAMSPAERKHAGLMRRHGGKSLTHLLAFSDDPEEQEAGSRIERIVSRRHKKAEGTYGSVRDEVPGAYDEAEFQRHMAQLGLKGNPRRR